MDELIDGLVKIFDDILFVKIFFYSNCPLVIGAI